MAKTAVIEKEKKTPKKKRKSFAQFCKEVVNELKKVTWPTKKETITLTGTVLIFILIFGLFVGLFDFGIGELIKLIA